MIRPAPCPVVHLELRTANLARACAFYTTLFGWAVQPVRLEAGSYLTLDLGGELPGGVIECDGAPAAWIPYVQVSDLRATIERAQAAGAKVAVEPREGPVGWRSVLAAPDGAEVALWQPKR